MQFEACSHDAELEQAKNVHEVNELIMTNFLYRRQIWSGEASARSVALLLPRFPQGSVITTSALIMSCQTYSKTVTTNGNTNSFADAECHMLEYPKRHLTSTAPSVFKAFHTGTAITSVPPSHAGGCLPICTSPTILPARSISRAFAQSEWSLPPAPTQKAQGGN